jgi:hypothetical protein
MMEPWCETQAIRKGGGLGVAKIDFALHRRVRVSPPRSRGMSA